MCTTVFSFLLLLYKAWLSCLSSNACTFNESLEMSKNRDSEDALKMLIKGHRGEYKTPHSPSFSFLKINTLKMLPPHPFPQLRRKCFGYVFTGESVKNTLGVLLCSCLGWLTCPDWQGTFLVLALSTQSPTPQEPPLVLDKLGLLVTLSLWLLKFPALCQCGSYRPGGCRFLGHVKDCCIFSTLRKAQESHC